MATKQRSPWLDFARGAMIIFVLIAHRTKSAAPMVHHVIEAFTMPMFFIISGYLYNNEKWQAAGFKTFFKSRFRSYIIPYFILGACSTALQFLYSLHSYGLRGFRSAVSVAAHMALGVIYSNGAKMRNATPLWFVPTLFLSILLFYGIMRCRKIGTRLALYTLCAAVSFGYAQLLPYSADASYWTRSPWHAVTAFSGIPMLAIGYAIRKYHLLEKANVWLIAACVAIAGYAMCTNVDITQEDMLSLNRNQLHNPILAYVCVAASCYAIFWLCSVLPKTGKLVPLLGRNTILITFLDFWVRLVVQKAFAALGLPLHWTLAVVIAALACAVLSVIWEALKKKYPKIALF